MDYSLSFKVNEKIYLRDPESTELGKQIVKNAIDLITNRLNETESSSNQIEMFDLNSD